MEAAELKRVSIMVVLFNKERPIGGRKITPLSNEKLGSGVVLHLCNFPTELQVRRQPRR